MKCYELIPEKWHAVMPDSCILRRRNHMCEFTLQIDGPVNVPFLQIHVITYKLLKTAA